MSAAGTAELLAFIKFLRSRDVPVSPADSLDAVHAASLVGYEQRSLLKAALAAVLAKSAREDALFNEAFDHYFDTARRDTGQEKTGSAANDSEAINTEPDAPAQASQTPSAEPTGEGDAVDGLGMGGVSRLEDAANTNVQLAQLLAQPIVQAMRAGNEAAVAIAIEKAAARANVNAMRLFTQRGQYTRKLLDVLGEEALRDAAIMLEGNNEAAFNEVQALRQQLRDRARDRVERAYMVHAAGDTEEMLDQTLTEIRLSNISPHQMARFHKLMERLARKLANRHGRRRRKAKRGNLHVPATLRAAVATDGIPFQPVWRRSDKRRPQVMAICDVSGSVAAYSKFLLMFLYALQGVLPRTRSFAFSGILGEVTDIFESQPIEAAVNQVNQQFGGATDYGRALADFESLAMADINRSTTVIILGDARNNDAEPRADLVAAIKARCNQLIWLNPEPRRAWGTGDSAMLTLLPCCHVAQECNNLKQLERIIDKLLSKLRRS